MNLKKRLQRLEEAQEMQKPSQAEKDKVIHRCALKLIPQDDLDALEEICVRTGCDNLFTVDRELLTPIEQGAMLVLEALIEECRQDDEGLS